MEQLQKMKPPSDEEDKKSALLDIIQKYVDGYKELLEGTFIKDICYQLKGGSRLSYIF